MHVRTQCPICHRKYRLDEAHLGRQTKCTGCGTTFEIIELIEAAHGEGVAPAPGQPAAPFGSPSAGASAGLPTSAGRPIEKAARVPASTLAPLSPASPASSRRTDAAARPDSSAGNRWIFAGLGVFAVVVLGGLTWWALATRAAEDRRDQAGRAELIQSVTERVEASKALAASYKFDAATKGLFEARRTIEESSFADVAMQEKLTGEVEDARRLIGGQQEDYENKLRVGWKLTDEKLISPQEQAAARARIEPERSRSTAEAKGGKQTRPPATQEPGTINGAAKKQEKEHDAQAPGVLRYPHQGLVGAWISVGPQGMNSDPGAAAILEFAQGGDFRWLKESPEETDSPDGRSGRYSVSGSTVTLHYDQGAKQSESREFAIKGRTLLLRGGPDQYKNYGDPYWDYFYLREATSGKQAIPSKSTNILGLLREKVSITGSLTMVTKDFRTWNSSGTYTTWTLDLKLTNNLPCDLDLGNTLILAQLPDDGLATGFVRVRGPDRLLKGAKTPARPHASYMLDDFDSTDGGRTASLAGASFVLDGKGTHPPHAGFGRVERESEYVFFEEFNPNRWLKPEAVAGMLVILPELIVTTPAGLERYRAIVSLRPDASAKDNSKWIVKQMEFVPMRMDSLRELLTSTDTILFKKVLAATWMVLADPQNAPSELSKVLEPKTQGSLLAACLNCYAQYSLAGFEKRAAQLEYDENAPAGIQSLATEYLDKLNYTRPGLRSVSNSTSAQPKAKEGSSQQGEGPPLGVNNLLAVRFAPRSEMVIRRIVVQLGRSRNAKLTLYSDQNGRPGGKLTEFSGSGEDFRGKQATRANQVYWLVVSAETLPGWAAPYWVTCARDDTFGAYASSNDGGKNWNIAKDNCALRTTIYYTDK